MKYPLVTLFLLSFTPLAQAVDKQQHLSAGETTVKRTHASAYSAHSANLKSIKGILTFNGGNKFFEEPWAQSVGSVSSQDGLGPLFNNNACQDCHVRDGRGHASEVNGKEPGTDFSTMLLRASKSKITQAQQTAMSLGLQANVGDSCIGGQLQHQSNFAISKEATQAVTYRYKTVSFADGERVELREPIWHVAGVNCEIDDDTVLSARVAPPMIGLGLLSLIDEQEIFAQQDINDSNKDGISGKANKVWSVATQQVTLGRFGWKAGQPTLRQQTAGAFLGDMGLTTDFFQIENCLEHQQDCKKSPNGNGDIADPSYQYEVSTKVLDKVTFYSHHLAVPARRNAYKRNVLNGQKLFNEMGCQQCHRASYTTIENAEFPELSEQKIYPYTDMLLHDMGESLSDFDKYSNSVKGDIPVEFLALANEWRTPPLWGIGLAQTVDPNATFLHDGRARTILEAVLWHDGEAKQSQQQVLQLTKKQRLELLAFLEDL
ncbi:thiol oxidoreductase [Psychromonas sp. psych-6C06]|uniref:di-heme oxidoreductase family protein n=1 Tax=Psychromonas sp. psych-6C06 TaxID=2058089 RepID=UPI000C34A39F|nr:di-heme oxidoredictase family protein [Psychromonas sp. psych-6C06]PKF63452.1 thiol oxidoreductase [Psychromonas sp. psych-6C06]